MATRGPQSLLDRREADSGNNIVRDRITRHRSPARSPKRLSYTSDNEDEENVVSRVPQPYRTSFSAVLAPAKTKRDRSRSSSPASSLKSSDRSRSKSPRGRKSSQPKHVTYDDRVIIQESDSRERSYTNLSDKEFKNRSAYSSADSSFISSDNSTMSQDSSQGRDYSNELRELSQQIVKEYSAPNESESKEGRSSQSRSQSNNSTPNGDMRPGQNGRNQNRGMKPVIRINDEYDHDRSISYRVAIQNQYSDEVKQKADALIEEDANALAQNPPREGKKTSSVSSLPLEEHEEPSGRLTPAKRGISSSIGNFFRRLSPHLGRRSKKGGTLSNASSQSLSQSFDSDAPFDHPDSQGNLSRSKFRRSLQKFFGKPKHRSRSASMGNDSFERTPDKSVEFGAASKAQSPPTSSVYMKSIEESSRSDKDMYHKFKGRQQPGRSPGEATAPLKPQAVKAHIRVPSPDKEGGAGESREKAEPPNSLDVRMVPKSIKSLQSSVISATSMDESIGDCSLDVNFTGSDPSLLSPSSPSKQLTISEEAEDGLISTRSTSSAAGIVSGNDQYGAEKTSFTVGGTTRYRNVVNIPKLQDPAQFEIQDSPRTPSYLRISSALSGYGHYAKYSAYRGIEKRSPYSSTLSLRSSRSDLTPLSPDMPIGKVPNFQSPTNYPPVGSFDKSLSQNRTKCEVNGVHVNNGVPLSPVTPHVNGDHVDGAAASTPLMVHLNGESALVTPLEIYTPTGDIVKDAKYFLDLTQTEENRMLSLCSKCEAELLSDTMPEEAGGKLRAAVGKANLLVNQRFRQFRDLCHQHQNPEVDGKRTKYEDLQGFWEMVRLQIDDVDDMFTEIDLMRQNGWREIKIPSRRSSSSSSPKSGSLSVSNSSTPSHTPGSRRKAKLKDTPESSPERTQKAKQAARAREDARKKMLAEKRAAMKQKAQLDKDDVEIFVSDGSKTNSPNHSSGTEV